MAQTGYTPISIYYSATASNTPTAGNLVAGELAINTADGKLFYKDSAGVVQVIGTKGGVGSSTTTQVLYNSSGLVVGSANMTFDGTNINVAGLIQATGSPSNPTGTTVSFYNGSGVGPTISGYQFAIRTGGTPAEALRVDPTGNVGIGTSSPSFSGGSRKALTLNAPTGQLSIFELGVNGSLVGYMYANASQMTLDSINNPMTFQNGGNERMRIDSSGNLLVGATSTYGTEKFNVTSSSSSNGARTVNIYNSSASSTTKLNNVLTRISSNGNGADNCINLTDNVAYNYYFGGNNGGAYVVASSNGVRLTVNATSWSSDSDERVKDIIEPISDAINKVSSLRAVIGKYKTDAEGTRRSFLIAQDVQKVLPEAVCDEQGTLMLAYTDVIPLLVASIKELSAEVQSLKQQLGK